MIADRKKAIEEYNTMVSYMQKKDDKPINIEELKEVQDVKKRILEINEALLIEFASYDKNRFDAINKIMSCNYYIELEKAKKVQDFIKQQETNFPLYGPGSSLLLSSKTN